IVEEKDALLDEPYRRVSIFLNVFNVHVQRTPVAGRIEQIKYNKGKFLNAASHKASLDNEQNSMIIHTGQEKVLVKQIAGLIARRIVCWAKEGDNCNLGQRFGLIRFGSRVDLFLPLNAEIKVSLGDHVAGGSSIIGYLK
ncbi:MAG: phosphatidylserine decarboxylase, partial [Nitrospinaceae bacterium]